MILWQNEKRKVRDLTPLTGNPRKASEKEEKDLAISLERFNLADPIIVNRDGTIIGGHFRLRLLRQKGIEEVDVRIPDRQLTEAEVKELSLRLNKNTGSWDYESLADFADIELLTDVGFDELELGEIFGDVSGGLVEPDAIPDMPKEAKTRPGDLWLLSQHRILCGDSTRIEDMQKLMNGRKADMVFTDPPYGVSYADKNAFLNEYDEGNRNQIPIAHDHLSEKEIMSLWKKSFEVIRDQLADVNSYYIFGPQIQGMMMMMMMMMIEAGLPYRHVIVWVKNNHVLGRCDYHYRHEPILFGWTTKHKFYGLGDFKTSVWEVDKPLKNDLHPTMKPVALAVNALLNSSCISQICLDPFCGSGSTLIACEKTGRVCYSMEIEPRYCDVILDRWVSFTGKDPVREDGKKWSEVKRGIEINGTTS